MSTAPLEALLQALASPAYGSLRASIVGTGGGCEAIEVRTDDDGPFVLITDGNYCAPFTRAYGQDDVATDYQTYDVVASLYSSPDDDGYALCVDMADVSPTAQTIHAVALTVSRALLAAHAEVDTSAYPRFTWKV